MRLWLYTCKPHLRHIVVEGGCGRSVLAASSFDASQLDSLYHEEAQEVGGTGVPRLELMKVRHGEAGSDGIANPLKE